MTRRPFLICWRFAHSAIVAAAVLAVISTGAKTARAADIYDDIAIQLASSPSNLGGSGGSGNTMHGYMEYSAVVSNRSRSDEHVVELTIPDNKDSQRGHSIRSITKRVKVGPGSSVRVYLWQPGLSMPGQNMTVSIDGREQDDPIRLPQTQHGEAYDVRPALLISQSVDFHDQLTSRMTSGSSYSSGSNQGICFRSATSVKEWSPNWLGYSRFDGVAVTSRDLAQMPAPVREALRQYVECGGVLLIAGTREPPEEFRSGAWRERPGQYAVGFGRCAAFYTGTADWDNLASLVQSSFHPWTKQKDAQQANVDFPVVEDFAVPVRGLFMLVLAFALVIGPLNIWLLSRWKKRIWLLWIVPVISLVSALAVFSYAWFSEGWDGHRRTQTITFLDENSLRATTLGVTAYYCPITPDGLRFDTDTEISPQLNEPASHYYRRRRSGGSSRTLDWTSGQLLESGWVASRVPAHLLVRKSQRRRERLAVHEAKDGSLSVVNGLGADVVRLRLADAEGTVWATNQTIPAGGKARLQVMPKQTVKTNPSLNLVYTGSWLKLNRFTGSNINRLLHRGGYVALVDGTPFLEPGAEGLKVKKDLSIVVGVIKRDDHGSPDKPSEGDF